MNPRDMLKAQALNQILEQKVKQNEARKTAQAFIGALVVACGLFIMVCALFVVLVLARVAMWVWG